MDKVIDKIDGFVSVVSLVEGNDDSLEKYLYDLQEHLKDNFEDYEIVLIDQGLRDVSTDKVEELLTKIPSVRYIKLAFSVHDDVALAAGLENAIGDFVILHSESEDPVECIAGLVRKSIEGFDIVIGVSRQNQSLGYKLVRPLIQWMLKGIGYNVPRNATRLRCLSRREVNAVTRTGRFHHQFYVRINNTGYPYTVFEYAQNNNISTKRTLGMGLTQGLYMLIFNSTKPLRWMSGLGVLGGLLAFSFSLYSLLVRYFKESVIEGWTTMVLFTSLLFMIMFIILAFLGEYLGRLLNENNNQSDYTVSFEKTSSVMINDKRENVIGH